MANWNLEDRKRFYMALKKCGTDNILAIEKEMPDKPLTELRYFMHKYEKCAYVRLYRKNKIGDDNTPVNQWIKLVKKLNTNVGITDVIPRVLKYIALFEKRANDPDFNLRECYLALSELCNGKFAKPMDEKSKQFLFRTFSNLAKSLKYKDNLGKMKKEREFVKNIKHIDDNVKTDVTPYFNKKKKDNRVLNPLKIPYELLIKTDYHQNGEGSE